MIYLVIGVTLTILFLKYYGKGGDSSFLKLE